MIDHSQTSSLFFMGKVSDLAYSLALEAFSTEERGERDA